MANLSQTFALSNPNFFPEAGEYLEANGYRATIVDNGLYFTKSDDATIGCCFYGDKVAFMALNEGEEGQRAQRLEPFLEVSRITHIDTIFDWMLLFHVAGIVPLKSFIDKARENGADTTGLKRIIESFINTPQTLKNAK